VGFKFIATVTTVSKLLAFKVEILENVQSYPFFNSAHIYMYPYQKAGICTKDCVGTISELRPDTYT